MKKQFRIKIFGRVQGVFFRAEACEEAKKLGLAGWARNTANGAVEILAQGEEAILDQFVEWCRKGPDRAYVENMNVEAEPIAKEYGDFSITR